MAKSALPLLLIGGVAAVVASKKKKKKKTTSTDGALADAGTGAGAGAGAGAGTGSPYGGGGAGTGMPLKPPYGGESTGAPKPKPPTGGGSKIPSGSPPNPAGTGKYGNYDHAYWDSQKKILDAFLKLGYSTPDDGRTTMNKLGKDGKLGGDDDERNPEVTAFQKDYNAVSRSKTFESNMGGLNPDGLVGPKVLNALKLVIDKLAGKNWKSDVVKSAAIAGFKA